MSFREYLKAKKTVEEDCLNERVLDEVGRLIDDGCEVFEAGAGVGSMVQHLVERGVAPSEFSYTAVDLREENVNRGRKRLADWGRRRGYEVERDGNVLRFDGERRFDVEFRVGDLYEESGGYDLVVAHALLDVLRLDEAVSHLFSLGDTFYFPVCFDGVTTFEPSYDGGFDRQVERAYHGTMDGEDRAGGSRTGRRVFKAVRDAEGAVTAAGSSDWVIFPGEDGYTEDERVVVRHVLETVRDAVSEEGSPDDGRLKEWFADREKRLEDGELVYIAHNIDFAGTTG